MQWRKDMIVNKNYEHDIILVLLLLLIAASVYLERSFSFVFIGIACVYLIGLKWYNREIGRDLTLNLSYESINVFQGESMELNWTISNHSIIPYLNGYLSFSAKDHVVNDDYLYTARKGYSEYRVPVSIPGKSNVSICIPFKAVKRGHGQIKHIQLTFPHLLNFDYFTLRYQDSKHYECIVYPNYQPVAPVKHSRNQTPGRTITIHSPYEDILQPSGTRDYVTSDPFHRIHWKASAKMQKLQTKIYDRNHYVIWTIIINIAEKSRLGNLYTSPYLEKILSEAAFISKVLIQSGYEVEIYVNEYGSFHLQSGCDINQLKRILNLLTRIGGGYMIHPIQYTFHRLLRLCAQPRTIILIGDYNETDDGILNKLNKQGHYVYHTEDFHLKPIVKGRGMYG
ncbi:hypothetical protein GCM10007063_30030 [Lentibacillus kapialis]|uniref:DUF58 domain-containing protein n=1 Tax=Lentibacillus kapialis TaxID=340214 RepID=A0A917Q1Q9_9BACI|nr:DUF58 domain-containing protein [Lentibacillus kapialis]GGK05607.1 hypothetical protein GCM10007063_30030 [Lentibacillus kapialis]